MRSVYAGLTVVLLVGAWSGAFAMLGGGPFAEHMTSHMIVVAVAAPLLALAVAGTRFDPVVRRAAWFPPVPASVVELVVVWAFHTPLLHHWARHTSVGFFVEQSAFWLSGSYVWLAALAGERSQRDARAASGIVALLLTSMHMTLLGALIALSPRPLFAHSDDAALSDQHLGGAIMLLIGGIAYLAGGLGLSVRFVRALDAPRDRHA